MEAKKEESHAMQVVPGRENKHELRGLGKTVKELQKDAEEESAEDKTAVKVIPFSVL